MWVGCCRHLALTIPCTPSHLSSFSYLRKSFLFFFQVFVSFHLFPFPLYTPFAMVEETRHVHMAITSSETETYDYTVRLSCIYI